MIRNAILHRGVWLMPNSLAHRLHAEGKHKELDEHLKALDSAEAKRRGSK